MTNDNRYYFTIDISKEQLQYANELVNYSITNHTVDDIFANDPEGKKRQREFRFTGTIGEVVFADAYELKRPTKSFGAIDGQDFGQDFVLGAASFDIKTMRRKTEILKPNYVLNIQEYQIEKTIKTDYYYNVSISKDDNNKTYRASFVGFIPKTDLVNGKIGTFYQKDSIRTRLDDTNFKFMRSCYEIELIEMKNPMITDKIKKIKGYKLKHF